MESMLPEWVQIRVSLVIPMTIWALEHVWTQLTFFCLETRRIDLFVCFTTPCKLMVVLGLVRAIVSRLRKLDLVYFILLFIFYFIFNLFFHFLFLEQLGLGLIGHTITSVTWWLSHKTDHETWENLVKDSRTDDVIQYGHHMLASWTTHGCLG